MQDPFTGSPHEQSVQPGSTATLNFPAAVQPAGHSSEALGATIAYTPGDWTLATHSCPELHTTGGLPPLPPEPPLDPDELDPDELDPDELAPDELAPEELADIDVARSELS